MSDQTETVQWRPHQESILAYRRGKMGISAVPGSGKTFTLSRLAANILLHNRLEMDQEVLVVTLVNSAVDNFSERIGQFIQRRNLLPGLGYRVRTLHGLANDILRERPDLVGLGNDFQILDEHDANAILEDSAASWLQGNPGGLEGYLKPDLNDFQLSRLQKKDLPELVGRIASNLIRYAKDQQLSPEMIRQQLDRAPAPLPLAEIGWAIYADYQRALQYRGAVDFNDLIRLALQALQTDERLLNRLRERWPFVLEDEAQDSSRLQEQILRLLAGEHGNWVRVGDPNQAIYETFTTANPRYLREFLLEPDVLAQELPTSGRSTRSILALANHLIEWTRNDHLNPAVRDALSPPLIQPTGEDDPQPNPPDDPAQIYLIGTKYSPDAEIQAVGASLAKWLPDHPESTVAVLAPRNDRAFKLVDELNARGLPVVDSLLRSSTSTRSSAGVLGNILRYLADPQSSSKLANVYKVWRRGDRSEEDLDARTEEVAALLRKCRHIEDFIWPGPGGDWLEVVGIAGGNLELHEHLLEFRQLVRRWQGAALLPIDQALLTLAQDLFTAPTDLAIAHKLAAVLRQSSEVHPSWRLPELSDELAAVARNERRFLGFSDEETGFNPEDYKGKVVVGTMHKAKGLEWDRVYLMSVNNYDFPSGMAYDQYQSERWFMRDNLNLEAEALAQLEALLTTDEYAWYEEGHAGLAGRLDYVRERLRLLYVGITRARRELVITWNTGQRGDSRPALPFVELQAFWENQPHEPSP